MAQIIRLRRGTLAELNSVTLQNGEIGIVTGSAVVGDAALKSAVVVGHTDGTNRLSIARIITGNATPDLSGVTGGSAFNNMLYHETDAKALKVLNTGGNTTLDLSANISVSEIAGNISGSVSSTGSFGYLNVDGDATIGGNLTFGDAASDSVTFGADITSNLIPDASDSYNLGSNTQRWNDLYLSGSISASGGHVDIDSATTIAMDSVTTTAINATTTLTAKGATGASFGDDTGTWEFDGAGALSETGMTTFSVTPSSTLYMQGGGVSRYGDDTGYWSFDGSGAVSETGMTTVSITPSSTVDVDAGGAVTIDSSAAAISVGGDSVAQKISIGGDTSTRTEVELNAILVDVNAGSGGVTIDAGATSNFTTSAGDIDINAAANLDLDGATVDIDSAGALSLQGAAASDLTTSAGAITVDGKTGVDIKEDGTSVITIDTDRDTLFASTGGSTSDPDVEFDGYVRHDGQVEVTDTTDSTSITTGALVVDGGVGIAKDLVVGGMVTAQEFHTEFVSASIMYSSGSTKFGDTIDDIHSFTGSINQSGSFNLNDGNMTIADTLTATNIGAFTSTGAIDFDSQNMTNVDIDSGTIDGTTIGAASHTTIKGTTIDATTDFTIDGLVITADNITNDAGLEIQTAAGDITLDPGGNNVLPGSDSADDLGVSGTAWRKLFVDDIELNSQGSVTNAVSASIGYISGSGNMKIDGAATFGGGYGSTGTTISSAGVIQSNGNIETAGSFVIGSADMNEADLEKLDGITDGTAAANKALVLDANSDITSGINDFQVSKLEIDSANDYLDVDTDLQIIAAADITLNPGGNNVKPGGDSEDDLGVSGTAWRTLYVDSIKMNGQGSIDGATHITGSGNLEISGNISGSINTTGSFSDLMAVGAGASVAASSASLVSFRNNANSQFGYLASADTQAITTGIVGYNTSTGNLTISSVIDGGSF